MISFMELILPIYSISCMIFEYHFSGVFSTYSVYGLLVAILNFITPVSLITDTFFDNASLETDCIAYEDAEVQFFSVFLVLKGLPKGKPSHRQLRPDPIRKENATVPNGKKMTNITKFNINLLNLRLI